MTNWRTWGLHDWNGRLRDHFFRLRDDRSSPVVVLLVTADELARATTDADADADEVRDAFLTAVLASIRRSKSLLEDATDYEGWPGPPDLAATPRFVSHLLFTCVAASESSDELGDEGRFVARLRELTQDQLPENSLQMLPQLWKHLATWLEANERRYRRLHLPDPGGLTRIGYTVKLAFPDRRDSRALSDLLDGAGLSGHEPPLGRVLSLVASERARFRRAFIGAFDEFRHLLEASTTRIAPHLAEHRFWAAVRESALRGRGRADELDLRVRVSLLCEEQDDRIAPFIVADDRSDSSECTFLELPNSYGEWRFALAPLHASALDAQQIDRIMRTVLSGKLHLPRISSQVEQGLLPFVVGSHGLLELAEYDQLADVCAVLVRDELLSDFRRALAPDGAAQPSAYEGWAQVSCSGLRAFPSARLEGTALSRTWILQESLHPTPIRLTGGVRADDGWIGAREVLPSVVVAGATSVVLEWSQGTESLKKSTEDRWDLQSRDITGDFSLLAVLDHGGRERREIRFYVAPATEELKEPVEPAAWIAEGIGGTTTLLSPAPFAPAPDDRDYEGLADRVAYLGSDVGRFVTNPNDAAWRIAHFAGKFFSARVSSVDPMPPARQIDDPHARHRWRKMLFGSSSPWPDPAFEKARRQVKVAVPSQVNLPKIDCHQDIPNLAPPALSSPVDAGNRLVRILAGRASTRAGLPWRDWSELARKVLGIGEERLGHVTRAWAEAGLLDVVSSARWWNRVVFARRPRFVGFQVGPWTGASLTGLVLPTTRDDVRRAARTAGALVEDRLSVCELVPKSLAFRIPSRAHLDELGSKCRIEVCWIDQESGTSTRHDGTSDRPSNYEWSRRWPRWSLVSGEHPGVDVEHHMRRDRPDYWTVSGEGGGIWSYELNIARTWAAALLGAPALKTVGETDLEAHHAYVPLPLARTIAVIGAGLPGPTPEGSYRYPVGSQLLRERVLDTMTRTFDPLRLAESVTPAATG